MNACEPQVRRRGFFFDLETGEPDTGEHENPEGFVVRAQITHYSASRRVVSAPRAPFPARASEAADPGRKPGPRRKMKDSPSSDQRA